MRVGVIFSFLLLKMRLKSTVKILLFKLSQKYSSGVEMSNLIIPLENIKVEGRYANS